MNLFPSIRSRSSSRLHSYRESISEWTSDDDLDRTDDATDAATKKVEDKKKKRTVYEYPEYLTTIKLLSFLHGALLMRGVLVFDTDLARYLFLPFFN